MSRTRVGVVGLGRMGLPIAVALADAGFSVVGFDTLPERNALATAPSRRNSRLRVAGSAADVAASVDILVTVLPGPNEVEEALLGQHGLVHRMAPGALWLDLSSNDPTRVERIAERATAKGIANVSAPMGGGPAKAQSRTLSFFVGGESAAVERARPVLVALGGPDAIDHVAESIGAGCTAKLLANLLWFGQAVAVTEAMLLGVSLGVPVDSLRRSLAASAGGSVFIDQYLDSLLAGDYLENFGIDRCVEELEVLVHLAARKDVPFELSATVTRLYHDALDRFGAIDGELLAAKLLEQRAGVQLRAQP